MNYTIHTLDGRHSYSNRFKYYIGFSSSMGNNQGPLHFANTQQWCMQTWGWSAEVRQWRDIRTWHGQMLKLNGFTGTTKEFIESLPSACNPHWSWSNTYENLRIYLASDRELAFFKLAHPLDRKTKF